LHRQTLKAAGARWSQRCKQWYWIGDALPTSIRTLVADAVTSAPAPMNAPLQAESAEPTHSIEQPAAACMTAPAVTTPEAPTNDPGSGPTKGNLKVETEQRRAPTFKPERWYPVPQAYVGQIGAAVGTCYVFGAATFEGQPVYLDVAGANAAVQSVWARLADGQAVSIVSLDGERASILLQPKGTLQPFRKKLLLGLDHLILLHRDLTEPLYAERSDTYFFCIDEAQGIGKLAEHVTQLVKVAVFPSYHPYLWEQGQAVRLVQRCHCCGGVALYHLLLDSDEWTRLIRGGLESGALQLPE
jgi:hypothetical protein